MAGVGRKASSGLGSVAGDLSCYQHKCSIRLAYEELTVELHRPDSLQRPFLASLPC